MELLIFSIYSILILYLLKRWQRMYTTLWGGWAFHAVILVKIVLAIYFYHFPISYLNDGPVFLQESKELAGVFLQSPSDYFHLLTGIGESNELVQQYLLETIHWDQQPDNVFNDSKSLIRLNSVLQLISLGNDYVNLLFIALISTLGVQGIYNAFRQFYADKHNGLFILLFFLPSALLWSSSVLKETYLLFGFGMLLEGLFASSGNKRKLLIGIGGCTLLAIKPYILACLIPAIIAYYSYQKIKKYKLRKSVLIVLSLIVSGWFSSLFLQRNLTDMISKKQFNFINLTEGGIWLLKDNKMIRVPKTEEHKFTFFIEHQNRYGYLNEPTQGHVRIDGEERTMVDLYPSNEKLYVFHLLEPSGSLIPITPINRSHSQLIKNIPEALFNTLIRPLPTDPPAKIEKWYFVLENWFIYSLILVGLFIKRPHLNTKQQSLVVFIVVFTVLLSLLIGWITPVIGAIIRYKIPIVFLLIGLGWLLLCAKNEQACQKQ